MLSIPLLCAFYLFATRMTPQDHVETALQGEGGESGDVVVALGIQDADEEQLTIPDTIQPLQHLSSTARGHNQNLTINQQELTRPHSRTSNEDPPLDDTLTITSEAQPSRSLNLSNEVEGNYSSNHDQIADGNGNGPQMPSTSIEENIAAVIKYCQLPFSIGIFVVVAGTKQSIEPRKKKFLKLCYASFLISILTGAILLTLTKQKYRGNVFALIFIAAIAFAWDIAGLRLLIASLSY